MRWIDFHTHIFPDAVAPKAVEFLEGHYQMPWECTGTLADITARMEKQEDARCVVFSVPTKPTQVRSVNDFLAALPDERLVKFGSVHAAYEDPLAEIDRVKQLGLKGFKFHCDFQGTPLDDERMLRIYEHIGTDYPILHHVGDKQLDFASPKRMARVLDLFPEHTFIAAHMGGYAQWEQAEEYLVGRQIYFDTSSTLLDLPPGRTRQIMLAHGIEKILFGTDYPAVSFETEYTRLAACGLSRAQMQRVLYDNADELLRKMEEKRR